MKNGDGMAKIQAGICIYFKKRGVRRQLRQMIKILKRR